MNKIVLLIILFLPIRASAALPDSSFTWTIKTISMGNCQVINSYALLGDTIINGSIHGKIFISRDSVFNAEASEYFCAIRDSSGMWSIVYNEETESHVTYNFNLGAGDTSSVYNAYLGYQKVYVNSVDSILIAGKYRKRLGIGFDPGTSIWEYWIEGIGSTTGLFYPACFIFDYGFLLSCTFYQDDLYHTFSEDGLCGCYKTDTYPREFDQTIEIYPVPVNDIIRIDIPYTLDHLSYAIFSLDGKNIDKNSIQPGTNEIDLSSCAPGSYVIILLSRNKKIMAKTIIAN